jgi:predicted O-methyltransferase YrrM
MKKNQLLNIDTNIDTKSPSRQLDFLTGYSGRSLLSLLQRSVSLCKSDEIYCEIGVFQGLSLISVAAENPEIPCVGIDNFAYFDPDGTNKQIVLECAKRAGTKNVDLIDLDYEDALERMGEYLQGRKIGVFFVDGPHDYRSQLMCLLLAKPHLSDDAIIVVDDSNYNHVRQANRDFIVTHPEFRLIFEEYTHKHPDNMTSVERAKAEAGWWNGVNVLVRDRSGEIPHTEPPTERDRTIFENEHMVHSMRYSDAVIEALLFANSLQPFNARVAWQRFKKLRLKLKSSKSEAHSYETLNMTGFE